MGVENALSLRITAGIVVMYTALYLIAGVGNDLDVKMPCMYCGCGGECSFFCPCVVPPFGCFACGHTIVWDEPH